MMTTLTQKSAARLTYETNALMHKMVRTRQLRLEGKQTTKAYMVALESIKKTKALCHKIKLSMAVRAAKNEQRAIEKALKQPKMTHEEMAGAVMEHAKKNYDKGWDSIVECRSLEELATELKNESNVRSINGAIAYFKVTVDLHNERQRDHILEAASSI